LDDNMTWSVAEGDFDEDTPEQYSREVTWYWNSNGGLYVLVDVAEKWTARSTFTQAGHYHLEVQTLFNGGPPYGPYTFTYDVVAVDPWGVAEVDFYRQPIDPQTGDPALSVIMRKRNEDWHADSFGDDCTEGGTDIPNQWKSWLQTQNPICYAMVTDRDGENPPRTFLVLDVEARFWNGQEVYGPSFPIILHGESADPANGNDVIDFCEVGTATTNGAWMQANLRVTTGDALPQHISHQPRTFSWEVRIPGIGDWRPLDDTTSPFWVTWDNPLFGSSVGVTAKRVDWVTDKAKGCDSESEAADAIWGALADHDPPNETGGDVGVGWELLDGQTHGACHQQAGLMMRAMHMLGIPASLAYVRGSRDSEDCENLEGEDVGGVKQWLILDFGTGENHLWNAFEGCCSTAGAYYAVVPPLKAANAYGMLYALNQHYGVTQYWVETWDNTPPGDPEWSVRNVFENQLFPWQQ
jgi:hypothetical protein